MSTVSAAPAADSSLIDVLEAEAAAVCGSRERIENACAALRKPGLPIEPSLAARLPHLAGVVSATVSANNLPIVALLCDFAEALSDPWPVIDALLESRGADVVAAALQTLGRVSRRNPSLIDDRVVTGLASRAEAEGSPLGDRGMLQTIAAILRLPDTALQRLCGGDSALPVRRLAARILDAGASLPSPALAEEILGPEAAAYLAPHLAWTRATHLDLIAIASGAPKAMVASLRRAEAICGETLLRELVGAIGWPNLNFGLTVEQCSGISVGGSFPLLLHPSEEVLLENVDGKERVFDRLLVVAYGGEGGNAASAASDSIARFRAYNLVHAELLADFLDVQPLTAEKVRVAVSRMDRVVGDFQILFASYTDECPTLAAVYGEMRAAIERALESEDGASPLSAELTRRVGMFEDPHSLSEVHTLHGLKRYLHQRALKLGMRLAEVGGGTSRSVTLVMATAERVVHTSRAIDYVDFEPESAGDAEPPYAVRLVIAEFGRQLVHVQQQLPKVKVFCYGNEVHYFISFVNHPAFVRIDYSPPARGGMIDLSYFGVSKYELGAHPDPSLPAVERFFRRLDFDIVVDNTRVHARYDKERAFDVADLCDKAASLFRLAPYLMDVDWVIGDLDVSASARKEAAAAWSEHFGTWGVLPYAQLLTSDRQGILTAIRSDAAGEHEIRWNGRDPYCDRFSTAPAGDFWDRVRQAIESRGLRYVLPFQGGGPVAQLVFEERILRASRAACARGEMIAGPDGLRPAPPERFKRRHSAECLAGVLRSGAGSIASSARMADAVSVLARGLRFRTMGTVNGYEVQRASLPLPGSTAGLLVLRDGSGMFRLALYAPGDSLHVIREADGTERESWSVDAGSFIALLRRANYPTEAQSPVADAGATAGEILDLFRNRNPHAPSAALPGERLLPGVAASPGRAVGPARLGLAGRKPADVDGAVVICPSMTPADGAFLVSSAGVVTTGGGALSHAGLLALQCGKPALIVSGTWHVSGANATRLDYRTVLYDERPAEIGGYPITERWHFREREESLRDGELVVVDADEGVLHVLGSDADALALHDSMRQLAAASRQLAAATADTEILAERGRRLRARHQIERVLGRIASPILARHAATELLLRDEGGSDREALLRVLFGNPAAGEVARRTVRVLADSLARRLAAEKEEALRLIPTARWPWEILSERLQVLRLAALVASVRDLVVAAGIAFEPGEVPIGDVDRAAIERLTALREDRLTRARQAAEAGDTARLRHLVDELERLDFVLGTADPEGEAGRLRDRVTDHDRVVEKEIEDRRIIDGSRGGLEIRRAAGTKAANLAQISRLGEGAFVPPWFAVTDRAFREALQSPVGKAAAPSQTMAEAIAGVMKRDDLTNAQKSALIREAWERVQLPAALVDEVLEAYADLGRRAHEDQPFVAVRSSAREEDLETAARAGEFDTFLFVRGEDALITYLKRAWSGLWSERALRGRRAVGSEGGIGGGVLVQKMVASAASGVLHTVNVAERRTREMVINAGLGLGEGIVSGTVAADRIVVSTEGGVQSGELRFRYLTAEKRERVVFNSRLGCGTARVETLYHQRLRPALEYVEICELVRAAARLESAYGYPLDIEFAIEGTALRLLQVRPIPTPMSVWRETAERWPLPRVRASASAFREKEDDP